MSGITNLYDDIISGAASISVIGLGYVGLPIAAAFSHKVKVIGFDVNTAKIGQYKAGIDPTDEIGPEGLKEARVEFTSNAGDLKKARFHIIAVPTPVQEDKTPDFTPVKSACAHLGSNLTPGSVVVFESTFYPGVTEDICIPILEESSGLTCGRDFKVGYSPERINPGDKVHRLETIVKIVAGMDEETLELVAKVYELVIEAGVYRASSIKVAEAAKIIENSQRDLNIAFMNELSLLFHKLGIDTQEVLEAAGTKWNFINFRPGLVGGHCIGKDPYYLANLAQQIGFNPQLILAGRRINDDMGRYIAASAVRELVRAGVDVCKCEFAIFGFTFKENCPDIRNTRVVDIVDELRGYGVEPKVCDPRADADEMQAHYGISLDSMDDVHGAGCLIAAVAHDEFLSLDLPKFLKPGGLLVDVKGIFDPEAVKAAGYMYWRL